MRTNLKILNSKEVKEFVKNLENIFECDLNFLKEKYFFFLSESRKKYYILTKNEFMVVPDNIMVNRVGNYFATIDENNNIRLSIDGSQIIGEVAKKNIIELNEEDIIKWMLGNDIEITEYIKNQIQEKVNLENNRFAIIKHKKDYFGCGKITHKKIMNYVPKERRIHAVFE